MDYNRRSGGISIGTSEPGRHTGVRRNGDAAAAGTAGMGISGGVDYLVCPYGHQCGPDIFGRAVDTAQQGIEHLCCTINRKFFLEFDIFQSAGLRLGFCVAGAAVGAGGVDDLGVLSGG